MKINVWLFGATVLLAIMVGVIAGISIGTYAVIDHVAYGLAGSTFVVNINETKMVDYTLQRFNETILPQLKAPYDINYDATCPGLNKSKTTVECIKEVENSK